MENINVGSFLPATVVPVVLPGSLNPFTLPMMQDQPYNAQVPVSQADMARRRRRR